MEEEGRTAEEETDCPADTDGHLRVELRPQHLRAHGENDRQVPEGEIIFLNFLSSHGYL